MAKRKILGLEKFIAEDSCCNYTLCNCGWSVGDVFCFLTDAGSTECFWSPGACRWQITCITHHACEERRKNGNFFFIGPDSIRFDSDFSFFLISHSFFLCMCVYIHAYVLLKIYSAVLFTSLQYCMYKYTTDHTSQTTHHTQHTSQLKKKMVCMVPFHFVHLKAGR